MDNDLIFEFVFFCVAALTVLTAGLLIAAFMLLSQAREYTRRLYRGPEVLRDHQGRPWRERF